MGTEVSGLEMYLVIAVLTTVIFLLFAKLDNERKENKDLNERLIARNHAEYVQNTHPVEGDPEMEWEQTSPWSRPTVVVRDKKKDPV